MNKTIELKKLLEIIQKQKIILKEVMSSSPKKFDKFMESKNFSDKSRNEINTKYEDFALGGLATLKMLEKKIINK